MKKNVIVLFAILSAVYAAPALANPALAQKYNCTACHQPKAKTVGPSWQDIARKYAGQKDAIAYMSTKIKKGGNGVWGPVPMPPNPQVSDADLKILASWILTLK